MTSQNLKFRLSKKSLWFLIPLFALPFVYAGTIYSQPRPRALAGHRGFSNVVAFSPDGKTLASGGSYDEGKGESRGEVKLWDTSNWKLRHTLKMGYAKWADFVAFSPDSKSVVGTDSGWSDVYTWDVQSGRALKTLRARVTDPNQPPQEHWAGLSLDGRTVASWERNGIVRLRDAQTGKLLHALHRKRPAELDPMQDAVFSPDGKILALIGWDKSYTFHQVELWDTQTGRFKRVLTRPGVWYSISTLAISPDGKVVAIACSDWIELWSVSNGIMLRRLEQREERGAEIKAMVFSPDGKLLAVGNSGQERTPAEAMALDFHTVGKVTLWDTGTGRLLHTLGGYDGGAEALAFSADGAMLACADGHDGELMVWGIKDLE